VIYEFSADVVSIFYRYAPKPRMYRCGLTIIALASVFGLSATPTRAQTYLQNVGIPTFARPLPVENGFINAANGQLHLEIPLGSYPQRGGRVLSFALVYDSNIWKPLPLIWSPTNISTSDGSANSWSGWRLVGSGDIGNVSHTERDSGYCSKDDNPRWHYYENFTWTSPDGTNHAFPIQTYYAESMCTSGGVSGGTVFASDGTGYLLSLTSYDLATVYAPDGTVIQSNNGVSVTPQEDYNGNIFSLPDTVGRALVTTGGSGNVITYTVPNAQANNSSVYTVNLGTISVDTNFGKSGVIEYSGAITVITEIDLPDGTKYTFGYDSGTTAGHYGVLNSLTLPTGAEIQYTSNVFADANGNNYDWFIKRVTPDGTWNYSPLVITSCGSGQVNCQQTYTIQKPSQDNIVYTFALNGGAWDSQEQYYTGSVSSMNLVKTVTTCFNFVTITNGQCSYTTTTGSPAVDVHQDAVTTTLPIPGQSISSTTEYTWDTNNYGNIVQTAEWLYYTGSLPSSASRYTTINYQNGSSYIAKNILNRPSSVTVQDGYGNMIAQTNYSYDGFALISSNVGTCPAVTGMENHDDTNFGTANNVRGNATQIQRLISGTSNYLTTSMTYDITGQARTSTDANQNTTTYCYADSFVEDTGNTASPVSYTAPGPTNAYLTRITSPLLSGSSLLTSFSYYWGTGQRASATDANGNTSYSHFYDLFNRLTALVQPNQGWALSVYSTPNNTQTLVDTYTGITGSTTPSSGCSSCRHDQLKLDPLGRTIYSYLVNDPDGQTEVDTQYDTNGRILKLSNPYRSTSDLTYGWETPTYDGLDRTTQVQHTDNNISHSYYGTAVASNGGQASQQCSSAGYGLGYPFLDVDETGNKRQTWTSAFGRVIEVDEPDSSGGMSVATCYMYDLNDNLNYVRTGGGNGNQSRTYSYDYLSRLTFRTNPESGTTYFYYTTSSGALCSGDATAVCRRTDAKNITTTYTYDALNRLLSKSYNDSNPTTASVTYSYDQATYNGLTITNGKGRQTGMSDGSGQTAWSYDPVGKVVEEERTIASVTQTIQYSYNLDSSVATVTYPSNRIVTYSTGNAERTTSVIDSLDNINYATAATYSPPSGPSSVLHGFVSGVFNGITESYTYNNRLQTTGIQATSPTATALNLSLGYGSNNNGQIGTQTNNVDTGRTQTYTYDILNRLLTTQASANSGVDCWGQGFGNYNVTPPPPPYPLADDSLGNLLAISLTKCSGYTLSVSVNSANQITNSGFTYDSSGNGNMTGDGLNTYTFDAENRIITASAASGLFCYNYDGNGRRVEKSQAQSGQLCSSTGSQAPTPLVLYLRSVTGDTLAETDSTGNTNNSSYREYIFFQGRRIARSDPSSGNVYYYFADQVGNTRAVAIVDPTNSPTDGTVCFSADYTPYGQETDYSATCPQNYNFTGYERDVETGLDYAIARYYNSRLARFMSPDPLGGDIDNPQSLNKYAYVTNDPCDLVDAAGLAPSCMIHVKLVAGNHTSLNDKDQKVADAMKTEINRIFSDSSGGDLGADFGNSKPDYTLTVYSSVPSNAPIGPNVLGYTVSQGQTVNDNGQVYQSRAEQFDPATASSTNFLGIVLARGGAHEIGHFLLQQIGHAGVSGLMQSPFPGGADLHAQDNSGQFAFTADQVKSIATKCKGPNRFAPPRSGSGPGLGFMPGWPFIYINTFWMTESGNVYGVTFFGGGGNGPLGNLLWENRPNSN
jgi:RHS repeat-associated protein